MTMFRLTNLVRVVPVLALVSAAGLASAEDRVTVDRQLDEDSGMYSVTRSYETKQGGSVEIQRNCTSADNYDISGCVRQQTRTGADGNAVTREKLVISGPQRTRSASRLTGPEGHSLTKLRRWRN